MKDEEGEERERRRGKNAKIKFLMSIGECSVRKKVEENNKAVTEREEDNDARKESNEHQSVEWQSSLSFALLLASRCPSFPFTGTPAACLPFSNGRRCSVAAHIQVTRQRLHRCGLWVPHRGQRVCRPLKNVPLAIIIQRRLFPRGRHLGPRRGRGI